MSRVSIDYQKASRADGDNGLVAFQQLNAMTADLYGLTGLIGGLTLTNDGGSPNTVIDIAAGSCSDDTEIDQIEFTTPWTKTTASWARGTGNGALDTGVIAASTWYYVFAILRPDTDLSDVLFSLSPTAPTMPASYTLKRIIGSFRTDAAVHILPFYQRGDDFYWKTPLLDVNTTVGTAVTNFSVSVPSIAGVKAYVRVQINKAAASPFALVFSPLETGTTAVGTPAGNHNLAVQTASASADADLCILTDGAGHVAAASNTAATSITIVTYGWNDPRGRNG